MTSGDGDLSGCEAVEYVSNLWSVGGNRCRVAAFLVGSVEIDVALFLWVDRGVLAVSVIVLVDC